MKIIPVLILAAWLGATALAEPNKTYQALPSESATVPELQVQEGNWIIEEERFHTPLWSARKVTSKMLGRPILVGFGVEYSYKMVRPWGTNESVEIDGFDPVTKRIRFCFLSIGGNPEYGTFAMTGNTWEWNGSFATASGVVWKTRGSGVIARDGNSYSQNGAISLDGKTWLPAFTNTAKRVIGPDALSATSME